MNHVITSPNGRDLGFGCSCGNRFATQKLADKHAVDQNLIEENAAKAEAAKMEGSAERVAPTTEATEAEQAATKEPTEAPKAAVAAPPSPEPSEEPEKPQAPAPIPAEAQQGLSPSNLPLDLENLSLNQINFIGQTMAKSGMFPDVTDGAKALVKILAGKEIGVTPFQAMTNIHIIQGKATMGANLMAAKVKGSGKYDYRIVKLDNVVCTITFKQRKPGNYVDPSNAWEDLGQFTYSLEDAKRAGLVKPASSWEKYPQNMLFARAISSGTRLHCPDVFNGNLVYVPEELGAEVNGDGEPIGKAAA